MIHFHHQTAFYVIPSTFWNTLTFLFIYNKVQMADELLVLVGTIPLILIFKYDILLFPPFSGSALDRLSTVSCLFKVTKM